MVGWTRFVLRHRRSVLAFWAVILLAGGFASARLSASLSNTFAVPGTDSEHVRQSLETHFGDRSDGAFTVVFRVSSARDPQLLGRLQEAVARAAKVVPTGKPTELSAAGTDVVYGDIVSRLNIAESKGYTDRCCARSASRGGPACVRNRRRPDPARPRPDLPERPKNGEFLFALPIALLVLLAVFGLSFAVTIPFLFAACTITGGARDRLRDRAPRRHAHLRRRTSSS